MGKLKLIKPFVLSLNDFNIIEYYCEESSTSPYICFNVGEKIKREVMNEIKYIEDTWGHYNVGHFELIFYSHELKINKHTTCIIGTGGMMPDCSNKNFLALYPTNLCEDWLKNTKLTLRKRYDHMRTKDE